MRFLQNKYILVLLWRPSSTPFCIFDRKRPRGTHSNLTSHSIKLPSCDNHLGILSEMVAILDAILYFNTGRSRDIYPHLNSRSVKSFSVAAFLEVLSDFETDIRDAVLDSSCL